MKQIGRTVLIPVFLAVVCAVFFYPVILSGKLPVPTDTLIGMYHPWFDQAATTNPSGIPFKNFLITDPVRQQIPWRKLVVDSFREGTIPSWNPYSFSGTSLTANIQAAPWYPINIIFLFLPFSVAWTILITVQPFLAALFLYFYLRNKNVSSPVAVFSGYVWAFCGFSIAWLTWGTIIHTVLWLPLILLSIDKLSESKRHIGWTLILTSAVSFTFFAGHTQIALYIFILSGLYAARRISRWIIAGGLLAVIATSIQWIPMIREVSNSPRITDTAVWLKEGWFLPWQHLVQFIAPDFFGNPATLNYWGVWNYGEFIGYVGILPLLCGIYALVVRKDRITRFFAIAMGLVFLFLLPTPFAKIPFMFHLPIISAMQPTRLMALVDICLIVLSGLGLDAYLKKPDKKIFIGIAVVGIILAGLWVYVLMVPDMSVSKRNLILPSALWITSGILLFLVSVFKKQWHRLLVPLILLVTLFDLFRFGWKFTPFTPAEYFFPGTAAISFLQGQQKPFRIMSLDNRIMPPNVNAYYGIESIEGYDPVYDRRYEEFIAALNRGQPNINPPFGFNRIITSPSVHSPLVSLLNVTYVLSLDAVQDPALELVYQEGQTKIYWYKHALPRVYPVESVMYKNSKQDVMDALYSPSFNPAREAVVEDMVLIPASPLTGQDIINVVSYTPLSMRIVTSFTNDRFVVVSNMYDSGWKASVDSVSVPIYRTNYLFQGIVVPKGSHTVTISHQ